MENKEDFKKLLICEYWFSSKSLKWDKEKIQIWITGMLRAWNQINPNDHISKLEVIQKREGWSKEEARKWYNEYFNSSDDESIESRFDILDIRPLDE